LISISSFSQYYDTGQDPASLKWMQIKTGRFKVIYPSRYGLEGVSFAQSLDKAYAKLTSFYPDKKFRIPVIIHNFSTQSNGYVAWAPRRMELYPAPEQNSIPLDFKSQLSIHELTHVLQMESLNSGFTKFLSIGLGEQFPGIVSSLLPLWYLEGEAVFMETILTESGRGRSPAFQKQIKALTSEKGIFKYDKMINGSFRDFIPDHYQTGYEMISWAHNKYDHEIWNSMLSYTANQPFSINPVNISLSQSASLTKKRLFDETFKNLRDIWERDISLMGSHLHEIISPDKAGEYINYYSPVLAGHDSIFAIKTSLSSPASFVLIKLSEKNEKKIFTPGRMPFWYISSAKNKVVWVENQPDPRWENRNYSVIKILDLRNMKPSQLTKNSRYMAASVSPDGKMIAAVENTYDNKNSIIILDPDNGDIIQSSAAPGNVSLQRPEWTYDGTGMTIISLADEGEGIMFYSTVTKKWNTLIEPGKDDIQSSFLRNDSLFYICSSSGTDNIFLLTPDKNISILTNSRFGTSDLCVSGGRVIFSDYSSSGNDICSIGFDKAGKKGVSNSRSSSLLINGIDPVEYTSLETADSNYIPLPYRKWQHLFNFHSWMPFYADIKEIQTDPASIRPGFTIMSQNHLSTLTSTIGYEYSADRRHKLHSRLTWKGWYPVIEAEIDYGNKPVIDKLLDSVAYPPVIQPGIRFTNRVSLPLNFSTGRFTQFLYPEFTTEYRNNYVYLPGKKKYDYGQLQMTSRLYFSNYQQSAIRDIYPKWAQVFDYNYTFSPFDKDIDGTSESLKTAFYFPGFFPNNGIRIRIETEKQELERYYMGNRIHWPRSYKNIYSEELYFLSFDYVMPLFYPDLNISSLFYLKRIRATFFYDYGRGSGNAYFIQNGSRLVINNYHDYFENFNSFGFEFMSDFHVFRSPFLISAGVQGAWKGISKAPSFELLLNIDIFGMSIGKSGL
jgi:hypothetical protein